MSTENDPEDKGATPKKAAMRSSEKKWGRRVINRGFSVVPSLLLKGQERLGISATELAILLHLLDFWWEERRRPYPTKDTIAARLQIGARQVQRHVAAMEKRGLVRRIERLSTNQAKLSNTYDLSGLVGKLKEIEPDFRKLEKKVSEARRAVESSRHRRPRAKPGATRRRSSTADVPNP